jgi:hypothetical protein
MTIGTAIVARMKVRKTGDIARSQSLRKIDCGERRDEYTGHGHHGHAAEPDVAPA